MKLKNQKKNNRVHWDKTSKTKTQKPDKNHRNLIIKQKSTEESTNRDHKAPQMATRSSSRLKSVPEKLKNYFTEQDEEYFSSMCC